MRESSISAVVLGGSNNALSVARRLARNGVEVVAINYRHEAVRYSRYARYLHLANGDSPAGWAEFLLGHESESLRGAVLLACSDEAIALIVENHAALAARYRLE